MEDGKYTIHAICTGNSCRSRMAEGVIQKIARNTCLEDLIEVRSSGMSVDKLKNWGANEHLPVETILKVVKTAYKNGIHAMTEYGKFVDDVISDEGSAIAKHDKDESYRQGLNRAASHVYEILEQFDKASTMLVMAEHGLVYPHGEPRQFAEDGSDLYVPMEEKHVEKTRKMVSDPQKVVCFDEFIDGKMEGSLAAIRYSKGKLDIKNFSKIYGQIEQGCHNLLLAYETARGL